MASQRERRQDPYPLTWEIPSVLFAGLLLVLVLGVNLGRGLANLAAAGVWVWPATAQLVRSTFDVIQGEPTNGLVAGVVVASPEAVLAWVLAVELVIVTGYGVVIWWCLRRWGSTRTLGVATAEEARRMLGRERLYAARRVLRPDLYGTKAKR